MRKLAVLPGAGDPAEYVLVDIALRIALFHRHLVEQATTFARSAGVGMVKRASFMRCAYVEACPPSARRNGRSLDLVLELADQHTRHSIVCPLLHDCDNSGPPGLG